MGTTVNLVAPVWIPTERHADATAAELEEYGLSVPAKIMGQAIDVASVAFLAGKSAGFITGQRISVNGGLTVA